VDGGVRLRRDARVVPALLGPGRHPACTQAISPAVLGAVLASRLHSGATVTAALPSTATVATALLATVTAVTATLLTRRNA
jgi:hypothetical protein